MRLNKRSVTTSLTVVLIALGCWLFSSFSETGYSKSWVTGGSHDVPPSTPRTARPQLHVQNLTANRTPESNAKTVIKVSSLAKLIEQWCNEPNFNNPNSTDSLAKSAVLECRSDELWSRLSACYASGNTVFLTDAICAELAMLDKNRLFETINKAPPEVIDNAMYFEKTSQALLSNNSAYEILGTLESFPQSKRQFLADQLFGDWAEKDPDAAGNWLNANRNYPNRDQLIGVFAECIENLDSEAARKWAETIKSEGMKEDLLRSLSSQSAPLGN